MEVIIQPQDGAMDQQSRGGVLLLHLKKGEGAFLPYRNGPVPLPDSGLFLWGFLCQQTLQTPPTTKTWFASIKVITSIQELNPDQDPDTTWWPPSGPVKEFSAKSSARLKLHLILFALPCRNPQTWLECRLDQLAATALSSLLTLILEQEVKFMGSGEGSELTTGFSPDVFPRSTP